jgi:hypothetical protein
VVLADRGGQQRRQLPQPGQHRPGVRVRQPQRRPLGQRQLVVRLGLRAHGPVLLAEHRVEHRHADVHQQGGQERLLLLDDAQPLAIVRAAVAA